MPKVSFVVPVYDGDSYLAETLESIRNQSLKDIEIIVIDDTSPDFTPELMEWYLKQDGRIVYHRFESNKGVQEARNYGNSIAKSDLICVCDHDDLCMKNRAIYSYYYMNRNPDVDCLTSTYLELDVNGEPVKQFYPLDMTRELFESKEFVWFHSSACYRKKDILEHPYQKVDGETDDWTFLDNWTKLGKKFRTAKRILANCRRTPWGVMAQRRISVGGGANYYL